MARGHVSDTPTPDAVGFNVDAALSQIFDVGSTSRTDASTEGSPQETPQRPGKLHEVLAAQPTARAVQDEVAAVRTNVHHAAASTASMMPQLPLGLPVA